MNILQVEEIQIDDADLGWASLQRFQNVNHTAKQITNLHAPPHSQRQNIIKQATQLRYCLVQAREYHRAGSAVTLATQPTLMYYAAMSLALAEILLKHTGAASLDRAREQHRHHGLTFQDMRAKVGEDNLEAAASQLIARPMVTSSGTKSGTFELWHQTARMAPLVGTLNQRGLSGGSLSRAEVFGVSVDARLPLLPNGGISLLDCLRAIPDMHDFLRVSRVAPRILRGRVTQDVQKDQAGFKQTIVIHPGVFANEFFANFYFGADCWPQVKFNEIPNGGILEISVSPIDLQGAAPLRYKFPDGVARSRNETLFWPCDQPLNEFGYLYVALFIAGNYARYYPDRWQRDVEEMTELATAIRELLRITNSRLPWLSLGELARKWYMRPAS